VLLFITSCCQNVQIMHTNVNNVNTKIICGSNRSWQQMWHLSPSTCKWLTLEVNNKFVKRHKIHGCSQYNIGPKCSGYDIAVCQRTQLINRCILSRRRNTSRLLASSLFRMVNGDRFANKGWWTIMLWPCQQLEQVCYESVALTRFILKLSTLYQRVTLVKFASER